MAFYSECYSDCVERPIEMYRLWVCLIWCIVLLFIHRGFFCNRIYKILNNRIKKAKINQQPGDIQICFFSLTTSDFNQENDFLEGSKGCVREGPRVLASALH